MTDYWLSRMMYDLQSPEAGAAWRKDRLPTLDRYPLKPEVRKAVLEDDIAVLAPLVNAYLLRFYLGICGFSDAEAMAKLHALAPDEAAAHG